MTEPSRALFFAVLVGSGLAWGSTQVLGKMAVSTGHLPAGLVLWQLCVGTLVTGAIVLARRRPVPLTRASLTFGLVVAVIGTLIPNTAFYISVVHLPAGVMSILISTIPLMAFPMAMALGMDRLGTGRVFGLLLGMGGVLLIALPQASLPDRAMVAFLPLAMLGPLFYAMETNFVARFGTAGMDPFQAMFLASACGAVICLPVALALGQVIDPTAPWGRAEMAISMSSVVHIFAYTAYVWLAARAGAVFAAQSSYIVTGSGLIWAMVVLDERFSGWIWAALVLLMAGIALVQPRQPARAATERLT